MSDRRRGSDSESGYFAEWFRRTVENHNMSGGDVARALGVSDGTVSRWSTGKVIPSFEACIAIGQLFHVNGLAVAVTAGRIGSEMVGGQSRLPLPAVHAPRERIVEHLIKTPGLTQDDKESLMEWYDRRYPE
ncbi:helix-turn-helix domain-containing protein [Streptomyces sp. NPDC012769]|uniref:helix-turn-helix domain-containing protein n=1 Tax=Streptomyces sp. NPDC012769 TaxID=3364848 RepID=UPI0036992A5C